MIELFHQSTAAQVGQAQAEIGRACDATVSAYRFYTAGWRATASAGNQPDFRRGLSTVVQMALRTQSGVEGGIWAADRGSLAYAFPTYVGAAPKTDLPGAELPRIRQLNQLALRETGPVESRYQEASQTLLIAACPLPGPLSGLSAWTMTRVSTFGGPAYRQLMAGVSILLLSVIAAAVLLVELTLRWSRYVTGIERALDVPDVAELPRLPLTGERELDRIVAALNDAGARLAESRRRSEDLVQQMAASQRLAAIGRLAAGVAHEIRNPIAAMRLRAENAVVVDRQDRYRESLAAITTQIDRLDRLVRRLLNVSERDSARRSRVAVDSLLSECMAQQAEHARSRGVVLEARCEVVSADLDTELIHRALENLVTNAIEAAPCGSRVELAAFARDRRLVLSVRDPGPGPPASIRDHLFEPFVTGRPDGTGLGLSIVREVAEAHGGTARFLQGEGATTFEIIIPWAES